MNAAPLDYLDYYLAPLQPFLADAGVSDIFINRPGEIWVERLGGEIGCVRVPELDSDHLHRFSRQVAAHSSQGLSRTYPLISATLRGGARIQIVIPPAALDHVAIAIRCHRAMALPLSAYQLDPGLREAGVAADVSGAATFLAHAVKRRLNIVISGGTSSGKTTLLNSLLREIPPNERLITIEDAPELQPGHENAVRLIATRGGRGEAQVTPNDLLEAALRMRPDRILLGELRGVEAYTFLRATNTGHPGSMTTIHADSPDGALSQLTMMILQGAQNLDYDNAYKLVSNMVDVVVQVARHAGRRSITAIVPVKAGITVPAI